MARQRAAQVSAPYQVKELDTSPNFVELTAPPLQPHRGSGKGVAATLCSQYSRSIISVLMFLQKILLTCTVPVLLLRVTSIVYMPSAAYELEAAEEDGRWQSSLGGFLCIKMGIGLFVSSSEHREIRKERQ